MMVAPSREIKRAQTLVELMMREMYLGLTDPHRLSDEQWDRFFGAKQSMIANLQKLVGCLAELEEIHVSRGKASLPVTTMPPITADEVSLLTAWLSEEGQG